MPIIFDNIINWGKSHLKKISSIPEVAIPDITLPKGISRLLLLLLSLATIVSLYLILQPHQHHPDGLSLQRFLCEIEQSWYSNGIALLPYMPITDCQHSGPQLPVTIFNSTLVTLLLFAVIDGKTKPIYLVLQFFSITFLLYSVYLPSKEILLSLLFTVGFKTNNIKLRFLTFFIVSLVRPAYFIVLFYPWFNTKRRLIALLVAITATIFIIQSGLLGDIAMELYNSKGSEYEGVALPLFEFFKYIAYPLRVVWNFIGVFGAFWSLYNEFHWNVFFNAITQIAVFAVLVQLIANLSSKKYKLNNYTSIIILYAFASATWPLPHTRYLYPVIPAALWYFYTLKSISYARQLENIQI